MRSKRTLIAVTYTALIVFALSLTACYFTKDYRTGGIPETAAERVHRTGSGSGRNHPDKIDRAEVPQTGQKRSYAPGDDGNLRLGKTWPIPRFTDNGDNTVTDRLTGLMWTKNADKANRTTDWEQALSNSTACMDGGYNDWRLPNIKELESLVDLGRVQPALTVGHPFVNVKSAYYWSSTTLANNDDNAWILHFFIGFVTHDDKGGSHYVWYVRNGLQSG